MSHLRIVFSRLQTFGALRKRTHLSSEMIVLAIVGDYQRETISVRVLSWNNPRPKAAILYILCSMSFLPPTSVHSLSTRITRI